MALGSLIFRILKIAIGLCISRTQFKYISLAVVSTQHFCKSVPICLGLNIYNISFFLLIFHSLTCLFLHSLYTVLFPFTSIVRLLQYLTSQVLLQGREWCWWFLPPQSSVNLRLFCFFNKAYTLLFIHWPAISNYFWIYSIWCVLHVSDTCFLVLLVTPKISFTQHQKLHYFYAQ